MALQTNNFGDAAMALSFNMDIKTINQYVLFTLLTCAANTSTATVYKCVDAAGTIHYQSKKCSLDSEEEILNVDDVPEVVNTEYDTYGSQSQIENYFSDPRKNHNLSRADINKMIEKKRNTQCKTYARSYAKLKKQVKRRCYQSKDSYCHLSEDLIEEKNYQRDLRKYSVYAPSKDVDEVVINYDNAGIGKITKPPLLQLRDKMKQLRCY